MNPPMWLQGTLREGQELLPLLATLLHLALALAVTLHALLTRRDVSTTVAWIGLAWLTPVVGALLYLLLGVNRIQRAGVALGMKAAWQHEHQRAQGGASAIGAAAGADAPCTPALAGINRLARRTTGNALLAGNAVTPLIDGDQAYPTMLAAIAGARHSVTLATYIFDLDEVGSAFADALVLATQRGVAVRVLVDAVGGRYSRTRMVAHLRARGVTAAAFLPPRFPGLLAYANLRNHRKIMVVDGAQGFTGGMNIRAGHQLSLHTARAVRCLHFTVQGPVVADMQRAFAIDWAFSTGEALLGDTWFAAGKACGPVLARGVSDGPDGDIDHMRHVMLGALASAQRRVCIVTPYFLPDEVLLTTLQITALRGVAVDIVLPARSNLPLMDWAMRPQLGSLLHAGCRVHLSPPPFDHSKLFLVDDDWSLIGSTNWDARSLRLNFEYNLECHDAGLVKQLDVLVRQRLAQARTLDVALLDRQPLAGQLRDRLTGLLSPYL
ncbi:MAG: phospholipase D-like domain-containing protein [Polaromonas sp.]|uniref:phospholipase D-like domain-containing protein n=1 Tax=Polaromonas sp. TaxID=1869339 RepID=UPI00271A21C9|nr:phospholipase D-like domain-containing protein [Polaromonas sp.]MDO9113445.1 phospholipase D-like domain-containing protein [Polaromonas sp.]MDP1885026.1 phospholipase D-like domain-containing protein [Polaromonas sp.]